MNGGRGSRDACAHWASDPRSALALCCCCSALRSALRLGCELLKNLVLTGFQHITALDLDTIDVSNLNRQFLFRRVHVGQSKAAVAAAAVGVMVPSAAATIRPLHANIKSTEFDHDFFAGFDLVMNALDNLEARRHVNRLCLSAERTLLESGTQGYAGQTTVITGGVTECFECSPVPSAKSFAVCTIRNTPDKPVHTVVWAKSIFAALFGEEDEGNIMSDARMDLGEAVEKEKVAAAADAAAAAAGQPWSLARFSAFSREVFSKLFQTEIEKQCEVKERWKDRKPPVPLNLEALIASLNAGTRSSNDTVAPPAPLPSPVTSAYFRSRDQSVLTPAENALFLLVTLRSLLLDRQSELGRMSFDKDDELAMDFVSAASNLRMENFGIGTLSRFAVKGIAGNIVHAIATTNAIAAGLMVVDALKILQGKREQCHTSWITRKGPALLTAQTLSPPNPNCFVCANAVQELALDTSSWTLRQLYAAVLKKKLSMNDPAIDVLNRDNFIGTEDDHAEDDEDADAEEGSGADGPKLSYLDRPLNSAGVRIDHGALLQVEDQSQKISVSLRIAHRPAEQWNEEETPEMFVLAPPRAAASAPATTAAAAEGESKEESKEVSRNDRLSAPSTAAAAPASAVSHKRKSADSAMEVIDDADAVEDSAAASAAASAAKKAKGDAQAPSTLLSACALSSPVAATAAAAPAPALRNGSAAEDAIELE